MNWGARTESSNGTTSPEELIAAAHASCFSMALSHGLAQAGPCPDKLQVSAVVTFEQVEGGWKIATSELDVTGTVPGMDESAFQEAAEQAKEGCPVSGALAGNVELTVTARLNDAVGPPRRCGRPRTGFPDELRIDELTIRYPIADDIAHRPGLRRPRGRWRGRPPAGRAGGAGRRPRH